MSRIPKIGSGILSENKDVPLKKSFERQITRPGLKRLNENQLNAIEKKRCVDFNSRPSSLATRALVNNNVPPLGKNIGFSEQAKRAIFKPPPRLAALTVRESMPAICNLPSSKPNLTNHAVKKAKRPAWDLKGRIQDMEEHFHKSEKQNVDMQQELQKCNQRIIALESDNNKLNTDVEIKSVETQEASLEIKRLQEALKDSIKKSKEKEDEAISLKSSLESLQKENHSLTEQHHHEVTSLKSNISSLTGLKMALEAQLNSSNLVIEELRQEIKHLTDVQKSLESENANLKQNVDVLESKQRKSETERRQLHNLIQELKGNIRVYCRMRPPLHDELSNGLRVAQIVPVTSKTLEVYQLPEDGANDSGTKNPKYEFSFDCIFPPSASQNEVFHEISQLVQSSLDGYNVCIFAYGQTGSGKTYTMEGPGPSTDIDFGAAITDERSGMIPRAVQQIFEQVSSLESKGWRYRTEVSFLEVYNERIHDLLSSSSNNNNKCEIKKTGGKGVDNLVSNVTTTVATSSEQVFSLLRRARVNRVVAATKCNERSSRSHYIFQMKIIGENAITDEKCEGTLNLVDLAGSERIKDSGSEGDRLQEAKFINKSLSNLGNVIMALSQKADHIPYRNSKLTHLLMNSLGGNSKTLMFVNISPDSDNLHETINSLRFATKVNQCNIGTAQKRVK